MDRESADVSVVDISISGESTVAALESEFTSEGSGGESSVVSSSMPVLARLIS